MQNSPYKAKSLLSKLKWSQFVLDSIPISELYKIYDSGKAVNLVFLTRDARQDEIIVEDSAVISDIITKNYEIDQVSIAISGSTWILKEVIRGYGIRWVLIDK